MLVHTVFFHLRKDIDGADVTEFRMGLESLTKIEHAEAAYVGTPADVPARPVLVRNYDFCLTVVLKDVAAHNAYQQDPIHLEFIESHKEKWKKVKVYDAD